MAVALSVNCHKPFLLFSAASLSQNPNPNSLKSYPYRKHCSSLSISTKSLRLRTPITNGLSQDSEPNNFEESNEEEYSLGVKAALSVLKFYKREISPLLPKSCRYVPTCSEYSMIAYKKYGAVKGSVLTAWRICRCNPLGGSGFDPPRWFDEKTPPQE